MAESLAVSTQYTNVTASPRKTARAALMHSVARQKLCDVLSLFNTDLARGLVDVVSVLQEQSGCLGVVLLGRDVQRWKMDLSTGVVFQQQSHDLVVTLLERHSQRREPVLKTLHSSDVKTSYSTQLNYVT